MYKWIIAVLAVLGGSFGIVQSFRANAQQAVPPLANEPVRNPHAACIAGAGLIEPRSESVMIGVPQPGLVLKVHVKKGVAVKAGDPIFELDARSQEAQKISLQAAVKTAQANLDAIKAYRRKEDEPLLLAKVRQSEANVAQMAAALEQARADREQSEWNLKDLKDREDRLKETVAGGASPETELERARYATKMGEAALNSAHEKVRNMEAQKEGMLATVDQARADLALYRAGPWAADVRKAEAALAEAAARLESNRIEIERMTVRAPLDGEVLRMNLRAGEYLTGGAMTPDSAPVVVGNLKDLHVRVDIDEFDAPRFKPGSKATAYLKGASREPIELEFEAVEPFVIPKRALTNSQNELVDTRVLQVIYRVKENKEHKKPLYVGQQVDVFIDTEPAK
ncbi:MAG: HlyD family efflux transporter periplasmic adaptor subunit [Planctomycetota bacterium]|nr:HlyD family efflux transporter periplasmic adaptor subunit [Planctomycetota bacterium]